MPNTPPPLSRILPVLTEVVPPDSVQLAPDGSAGQIAAAPSPPDSPPKQPRSTLLAIDQEQLIATVLERIAPRLQQQLRVSLLSLVEEHLRQHAPHMQRELELAVQAAVTEALQQQPPT